MVGITSARWGGIERWSPTLFLIGGVLLLGHAALAGVRVFTEMATPPDVFVTAGHCLALVGLLGLLPVLESGTPRLARAAGLVTVIALGGWSVMTLTQVLALAGVVTSIGTALPGSFVLTTLGATILAYGLSGVGTLRRDTWPPRVGVLVLAPGGLITAVGIVPRFTGGTALDSLVLGGGLAASMLTLGYTLRTWNGRNAPTTSVETGVPG